MNQKLAIIKHGIRLSHTNKPIWLVRHLIGTNEALIWGVGDLTRRQSLLSLPEWGGKTYVVHPSRLSTMFGVSKLMKHAAVRLSKRRKDGGDFGDDGKALNDAWTA